MPACSYRIKYFDGVPNNTPPWTNEFRKGDFVGNENTVQTWRDPSMKRSRRNVSKPAGIMARTLLACFGGQSSLKYMIGGVFSLYCVRNTVVCVGWLSAQVLTTLLCVFFSGVPLGARVDHIMT